MDECQGSTIHNSTVNANGSVLSSLNGTLTLDISDQTSAGDCTTNANTPWYNGRNGKYGSSINFDGTDDYINIADNDMLDFADTRDFTMEAWISRSSFTTDDTIVAKKNGQTAAETGYLLFIDDSTDRPYLYISDGTDQYTASCLYTITSSDWTHIVAILDESSSASFYINGNACTTAGGLNLPRHK
jgi:hypothetical protein